MLNPYDIGPVEPEIISIQCPCCGTDLGAEDILILNDVGDVAACKYCVKDYYEERFQDWLAEQYKTAVCYWVEER